MAIFRIFGDSPFELPEGSWPTVPAYVANGNANAQDGITGAIGEGPAQRDYRSGTAGDDGTWPPTSTRMSRCADFASLPSRPTKVVLGIWCRPNVFSTDNYIGVVCQDGEEGVVLFGFTNQSAPRVVWQPTNSTATGREVLYQGGANDITGGLGVWQFYEFVLERSGGSLSLEYWVGGVKLGDAVVTDPFTEDLLFAGFCSIRGTSTAGTYYWHGGYVADERFGPCYVDTARPNLQGHYDEWAGVVADINNDVPTADGISGGPGQRTTFEFDTIPDAGEEVLGVQVGGLVGVLGAGVKAIARRGTDDADVHDLSPAAVPVLGSAGVGRFDPFTESVWTLADVNDTEFGFEAVTEV